MGHMTATSNRHSITEKQTLYRPVLFNRVGVAPYGNSGITIVLDMLWHRGFPAKKLLIPIGEDWSATLEEGAQLFRLASSYIAKRHPGPIPFQLPTQLQPESQSIGVSMGIRDVLVLSYELRRVANLFGNNGKL